MIDESIIINILFALVGIGIFVRNQLIVNNYEDRNNLDGVYKPTILDFFILPNDEYLGTKRRSNMKLILHILSYSILAAILGLILLVVL